MILSALENLYDLLSNDEECEIIPEGLSLAPVSHIFYLSKDGTLESIQAIAPTQPAKHVKVSASSINHYKSLVVPFRKGRSGTQVLPYLFCDNVKYFLGFKAIKPDENNSTNIMFFKKHYEAFKDAHIKFLSGIDNSTSNAIILFLNNWNPEMALDNDLIKDRVKELTTESNIVFKVDGDEKFAHENPSIFNKIMNIGKCKENKTVKMGQCLVSGKIAPITRTHPTIKNIKGASGTGAMLVCSNKECFESYGHKQGYNSPVSEISAFKYGAALNYLTASPTNHIYIGNQTMVFWADGAKRKNAEDYFRCVLNPNFESDSKTEGDEQEYNHSMPKKIADTLKRVRKGLPVPNFTVPENCNIYILTLSPDIAKLSIRDWKVNDTTQLFKKISQHYEDLELIDLKDSGIISPEDILLNLASEYKDEKVFNQWGIELISSIISGKEYCYQIYIAAVRLCQNLGENGGANPIRVAFIKAYLKRHYRLIGDEKKEEMITVSLNKENNSTGYLLGRLFGIMEKAQYFATSNSNATSLAKYMSSAPQYPSQIFQILFSKFHNHIEKLMTIEEKRNLAIMIDKEASEIVGCLDKFPTRLSYEEQGMFNIGYYHQKAYDFKKASKSEKNEDNPIEPNL